MKVAKKFLPALLVGMSILMVGSPLAMAEEESSATASPTAAQETAAPVDFAAPGTTGDPISILNSWYYPYGEEMVDGWYYGWYVRGGATFYGVDGDTGRFREDRFIDNRWTGGIEQLYYARENLAVSVTAVPEDFYAASGHYIKPDAFRVDFDFSRHREYFDGTMEPLNPTIYPGANGLSHGNDDDLNNDWTNLNLQAQLLIPELPHVIVGWHHWSREGEEVLYYGGRANPSVGGFPPVETIPTVNHLDGESNTVYVEIPVTIKDKYNFNFRQEYEKYDDDQKAIAPSNSVGGTVVRDDDPEWREFRTLFSFDSFVTPNIYATANYYHDDVKNKFDRNVFQPGSTTRPILFDDTDVDNRLINDVLTFGAVFLNVAKDLTIHANFKVENADIDGKMTGLSGGFTPTPPPLPLEEVLNATDTDETRFGEYLALVWKGIPLTTVKLEGEWEQRDMDLKETIDSEFARKADIDYNWQQYTITAVTRPRSDLRLTARYRYKDQDEDYDEKFLLDPGAYPGFLGDLDRDVHLVTLKADWHFLPAWTTTARYDFQSDERKFDAQSTEGQNLRGHMISGTIYGNPCARLLVTAMAMYEKFKLNTPTDIPPGSNWAVGEGTYDTHFETYILFLSSSYAINDKWLPTVSYQHTENSGKDVDSSLDEVWVGVEYKLAKDKTIYARYEYFDYDNDLFGGFDDYEGHGVYVALAYQF